jgi:tetratricopeptide (TPR) repeat protein
MADLYAVVRRHLDARGMSLRALAVAVHHDASYLSKALRGLKPFGPKLARDIDDALAADGEIIREAAKIRAPKRPARSRAGGQPVPESGLPRRDFVVLAMTVTSLLDMLRSASPDLPERIERGAQVDAETAAGLESVMGGYRQIYQSAPSLALLDPVCGALSLLTEVAPKSGRHRNLIVSLIGQASSLAATMLMLDQGDYNSATSYLAVAARAAQQCGDNELLSITMAARAFHSAYGGDPAGGLAFAVEASALAARVHPRTRGWVSAVESEMHATAGGQAAWERAVDAAGSLVVGPMPDRPWKGIGAFTPAKLLAYQGAGLMRLHRYAEAQRVLSQALDQLDPVQAKHRTTAHIDLADAYALDGKPDEAAVQAMLALDIIAVTGHAESLRRAARIHDAIRRTRTAATRELGSRLLAVRAESVG